MRRAQIAGFTMIELLVAMTLGMLLMIVLGQVFVTSKESYRTTEDLSRLQESARFSVAAMSRVVRMASFTTDPLANKPAVFVPGTNDALDGTNGAGTTPDSLTVRYQGSGTPIADESVLDCHGNPVRGGEIAVARFYIATGSNGAPALFCDNTGSVLPVGSSLGPVELAPDVENLQILYGEDTNGDGTANKYVARADVGTLLNVVSVRFALLLRSSGETASALNTNTYNLLGVVFDPVDDRRMRRIYTATITLRNRAP